MAYREDKRGDDNRDNRRNNGAYEPSDHEILEGRRRRKTEDQGWSVEYRNIEEGHGYAGNHRNRT